jgi:hypothetical protein
MQNSVTISSSLSDFNNVYRLFSDNFILDIYYTSPLPQTPFTLLYTFNNPLSNSNSMNGKIVFIDHNFIYVSFGGLIGKFINNFTNIYVGDDFNINFLIKK